MVQKDKLVQLYFSEYKESAKKLKKKNTDGKKTYEIRIRSLSTNCRIPVQKKSHRCVWRTITGRSGIFPTTRSGRTTRSPS